MPTTFAPPPGTEYDRLQVPGRATGGAASRAPWSVLGVLGVAIAGFAIVPGILAVLFQLGEMATGKTSQQTTDALSTDHLTPAGLALLNLSLAGMIPVVLLTAWLVNGLRPGFVLDVLGRVRWRWFALCLGLAVVTFAVTGVVAAAVPGADSDSGPSLHFSAARVAAYALVILLLTPLQAAGEEFAFRGYLLPAIGAVARWRWVAIVGSAAVFALAHGVQNAPLFVDRLAFGLLAGWLAVRTGGIEAGISLHVVNNFLAFGSALASGTIATAARASSAPWSELAVTATQTLVALALITWAARRWQPARRVDERPVDFAPPQATL
jgi:uncharacterized protein